MGQPPYCSAAHAGCGERGYGDGSNPLRVTQQYLAFFRGGLAFLHRHFLSQSPPSHPLNLSLSSQQQPSPWDFSTIPRLQLPATAPSSRLASLSGECVAAARTVWFSFHLGCHRSAVSLSALNVSPLTQFPRCRDQTCFSSPTHWGQIQSSTPGFPLFPLSYQVLHGSIYPFPLGMSSCSCSAGVLCALLCLMYPWKDMYSMSTYSSAILFSEPLCFQALQNSLLMYKNVC